MAIRIRQLAFGLAAWVCLTGPAAAQENYDLEADIISDAVIVFPTKGPAWWKATKGDSTVWIFALPPSVVPRNLKWNQEVFARRIGGARAMIMAPMIYIDVDGIFEEPLPLNLAKRIDVARRAERQMSEYHNPVTMGSIYTLKRLHFQRGLLDFLLPAQVRGLAQSARVAVINPPRLEYIRSVEEFSPDNPAVIACAEQLIEEVEAPPHQYRAAGRAWAEGRVAQALEAPRETSLACGTPMHASLTRRAIEWQTDEIIKALEEPGKVVAVVHMRQLLAREGILQRLRDQGYTVADPKKPLDE